MQKERPLSPHLQIYKMHQLTTLLSLLHRSTGIVLAVGTILLVYWLTAIAAGPEAYAQLQECFGHWFMQLLLFGWTFCLFYHLCNGIRHLFWDIGKGFEISTLYKSGTVVVIVAAILTAATIFTALNGGLS